MASENQNTSETRTAPAPHTDNRALWVIVAILTFFFLISAMFMFSIVAILAGDTQVTTENIGVVPITGTIADADSIVEAIRKMNNDEQIKAILIRINSPGGSVSASQEMLEAIQSIRKPVAISMGDMAASGGFYVACAGPKIFANPGTLTGSIGVISQIVEFSQLLDFFNVKVNTVKTGELKDSGSPYREFSKTDQAYFEQLSQDLYGQFVDQVATARKLPREQVLAIADGRALSGKQAKEAGLVDELGGMHSALEYLRHEAKLSEKYEIIYPPQSTNEWIQSLLAEGSSEAGKAIKAGAEALTNNNEPFQYLYKP